MIMADEQKADRPDQHQQEENDDEQQQKEHNKEETPQSPPSKLARVSLDESSAAAGVVTTAAASPLVLGRGPGVGTAATAAGEEGKPPGFTFMQMQEFHHQALIFKHMVAGIPVPILPIWKSVAASYGPHHYPSFVGLGNLCYDFRNSIEPEPGRCRRRDGKQWRCSRDVVPDQKYCERHMQRGRNHSRKPVEAAAAATTTSVGMDESSHDAQSPHHRPPGFRASPSTGGFATPSTQASQPYGYEAINQMMMEMNMSPAGSSSQYYGGGYHQVMDPFYAGMVRGSLPPPGYSFPVVGSPRTLGPYTRFLQPDILPPFGGPSPPFSGTPLPSHSEKHTSEDTCSSKKSRGRDDSDVSSSVKKSKMSIGGKISKALNKLWEEKHDDFVIPYLADLSRQGYKVDKTFKASAFSMAAHAVNKKFGTDFGGPNVSNHYRSLRTRFQDICSCFNISGAGWDEESRTITLDPISYDRWEKKNTKLKAFVNKPLTHFDDLRLIIGDDFATEELKKSVFDKFGKIPFSAIHVTTDPLADMQQDAASAEEIVDQPIGGSGGSSGPIRIPYALGGGSKSTKPRKKKQVDEDVMRTMVDKVGDLSNAIRQTIPTHWTVQLSQCVYGHLDYDDVVLDTAYARLFESEMVARFFIAKPLNAQKRYLDKLARELKWDVPTSRARVEIVSSSDEDGGGGNDNEVNLSS